MVEFMKIYDLEIRTLTPVHIGTGEVYDPTNYVIDIEGKNTVNEGTIKCPECDSLLTENDIKRKECGVCGEIIIIQTAKTSSGQAYLYKFNPENLLKKLDKNSIDDLTKMCLNADSNTAKKIQTFFKERSDKIKEISNYKIPISNGLFEEYLGKAGKTAAVEKNGSTVINALEINQTIKDSITGQPIIPGSSIKGAIRTGCLNFLQSIKKIVKDKTIKSNLLEKGLFGISNLDESHPFRSLCISDCNCISADNNLSVLYEVNRKKKGFNKNNEVYGRSELINKGTLLKGTITIKNNTKLLDDIIKSCQYFYGYLEKEIDLMNSKEYIDSSVKQDFEKYLNDKSGFLLKLGRHVKAEATTIQGHRSITIRHKKENPEYDQSETTTWWFAADNQDQQENLYPFGWVFVKIKERSI